MARWTLPSDPELASKVLDTETRHREIGLIGYLFGSGKNQAGNIGGAAMLFFSTLLAIYLLFGSDTPSLSKKDGLLFLGGFVSLSLGFVFGQKTSGR